MISKEVQELYKLWTRRKYLQNACIIILVSKIYNKLLKYNSKKTKNSSKKKVHIFDQNLELQKKKII